MGKEIETTEKGKGTSERGKDICSGRAKDCWIDRRQTWPIGKWQFIKVKGETLC